MKFKFVMTILLLNMTNSTMAEEMTVLKDTVSQGSGIIDLFKDVTSVELESYLDSGTMYLGVDLNEAADGTESSTSVGVAIESMEMIIQTTDGDFSFAEFYTNTTAMITAEGNTVNEEYYTLFGTNGSNAINGGTKDTSSFDDVIMLTDISYTGEIINATLYINFLDTGVGGENETFFDYSNGFEELALFTYEQALNVETTAAGISASPESITYDVSAPSGAPAPPWPIILGLGAIWLLRARSFD